MKTRQEIKAEARELLRQNRSTAILVGFVYLLVTFGLGVLSGIVGLIEGVDRTYIGHGMYATSYGPLYWIVCTVGMLFATVLAVNMIGEYIKIWHGQPASVGEMFGALKVNFLRKLGGMLWMTLFISLWSLLLFIPGVIKTFSYFFTPNILAEYPNVTATQAIKISMKITKGYKMDIFVFVLSFLGWSLLSLLTLGILSIVFVMPYFYIADAGLYTELKNRALAEGVLTEEDLGLDVDGDVAENVN